MPGGTSAASSLYSGIFEQRKADAIVSQQPAGQAHQATDPAKTQHDDPAATPQSPSLANDKSQAWSAALRFAPRKSLNTAAKHKRPTIVSAGAISTAFSGPSAIVTSATSATPTDQATAEAKYDSTSGPSQDTATHIIPPRNAPIVTHGILTKALAIAHDDSDLTASLPVVTEPPSLFLSEDELQRDRDVFKARAEQRGESSTMPLTRHEADVKEDEWWDGDEDVNGFLSTSEGKKTKRKKRKRNLPSGHHGGLAASLNMDADYDVRVPNDYHDFTVLLRKRREMAKRAIEADGDEGVSSGQDREGLDGRADNDSHRQKQGQFAPPSLYTKGLPENRVSLASASISRSAAQDDDEKPYLSPPPTPLVPPPGPPPQMPMQRPSAISGEEAYQRRLAMSQQQSHGSESEQTARSTAAAIAARLTRSVPIDEKEAVPSRTATHVDPSTFAERLMMKQGWTKGEALGAEGNKGIIDPILAKRVTGHSSKQQASSRSATMGGARGTLVNAHEDRRRAQERTKYGEPSCVILLDNMLSTDEEIDEELTEEIGEECAKHGHVERVFVWPILSSNFLIKRPRVFVQFRGMAGAWQCIKELDGRFFAGNTVCARFYPLHDFMLGQYDQQTSKDELAHNP